MSIQWTFIAGYLYFEIAVVTLLISPIFGPKFFKYFFRSRLYTTVKEYTKVYFLSILGILSVFLMDSIREILKYSHSNNFGHTTLYIDLKGSAKLFRAQRNFYITGFSIFLAFVIRRLIIMFRNHYELQSKLEAIRKKTNDAMKLANSVVTETKQFLNEKMSKHPKVLATFCEACPSLVAFTLTEELFGQGDELETP